MKPMLRTLSLLALRLTRKGVGEAGGNRYASTDSCTLEAKFSLLDESRRS